MHDYLEIVIRESAARRARPTPGKLSHRTCAPFIPSAILIENKKDALSSAHSPTPFGLDVFGWGFTLHSTFLVLL
jgi:hypothetical protein